MTNQDTTNFEIGKTYRKNFDGRIKDCYLCIAVDKNTVTFLQQRRLNKRTGEMVFGRPITCEILGKNWKHKQAILYTWYVDGAKKRDTIFSDQKGREKASKLYKKQYIRNEKTDRMEWV
tara:strand:+ start:84 stop:440 length:357 start_codon:yes stop_codon:yes gene_type:complete